MTETGVARGLALQTFSDGAGPSSGAPLAIAGAGLPHVDMRTLRRAESVGTLQASAKPGLQWPAAEAQSR